MVMKRLTLICCVLLISLANVSCYVLNEINQKKCPFNENAEVIAIGKDYFQPLINALEKYKNDNGHYPKNVFDLTPKYINKIPLIGNLTRMGITSWDKPKINNDSPHKSIDSGTVHVSEDDSFSISFQYSEDIEWCRTKKGSGMCTYNSKEYKYSWGHVKKGWDCPKFDDAH